MKNKILILVLSLSSVTVFAKKLSCTNDIDYFSISSFEGGAKVYKEYFSKDLATLMSVYTLTKSKVNDEQLVETYSLVSSSYDNPAKKIHLTFPDYPSLKYVVRKAGKYEDEFNCK